MGAFSTLLAFDTTALHTQIAPALRRLLDTGERAGPIATLWDAHHARNLRYEQILAEHYAKHPRPSAELKALAIGLAIRIDEDCEILDQDLGLATSDAEALYTILPSLNGSCFSATCRVYQQCPMHQSQKGPVRAEVFGALVKDAVIQAARDRPAPVILGRHATLYDFAEWWQLENGIDDVEYDLFLASEDVLPSLLLRLYRRAAAWGWGDGGFGEGLLGWLDPSESGALAAALGVYSLDPEGPVPANLDEDTRLPQLRTLLGQVRSMASLCAEENVGMLLRRD